MLTKAPRGTKDVLPYESYKWQYIEKVVRNICKEFGYKEIRTPIFEHTELFERGVGETTDVVSKEMYTFLDKGNRSITLKAEGTAPAARLYIENKLYSQPQPIKVFYITPVLRYERPQKGRLREHHQFGVEVFGSHNPSVDAEVISIVWTIYKRLNIKNINLNINSIGCPKCRNKYNELLKKYLEENLNNLCDTCKIRYEKNPMRTLDCKNEVCQENLKDAPLILDHICDECKDHFEKVKNYLKSIDIPFTINPKIVRGLDYYTKTAFEFISEEIGAQGTVCGGGRYDGLVKSLGGPDIPGVGFGMGLERLLLTLENNNISIPDDNMVDIFIVTVGENVDFEAFKLMYKLRNNNIRADKDHLNRSTKAQFKYADKIDANYTIVIGEDEIKNNVVTLKDMKTGEQKEIKLSEIVDFLKVKLGR